MALPVFGQGRLYVIRAPLGNTYITCVYALMAGKSQVEYEELLRSVIDACRRAGCEPDPIVVMTDFETVIMRATADGLGMGIRRPAEGVLQSPDAEHLAKGLFASC